MMIDTATGMRPGERYAVENLERTPNFSGFFLDGKYYLGPELMTAVGCKMMNRFSTFLRPAIKPPTIASATPSHGSRTPSMSRAAHPWSRRAVTRLTNRP